MSVVLAEAPDVSAERSGNLERLVIEITVIVSSVIRCVDKLHTDASRIIQEKICILCNKICIVGVDIALAFCPLADMVDVADAACVLALFDCILGPCGVDLQVAVSAVCKIAVDMALCA